jgi:hypothetical protein
MTKSLAVLALSILPINFICAQGVILFGNNNTAATKISTNSSFGGGAAGLTQGGGSYIYGLFYSTNSTSVNGQTAAVVGANYYNNYAFQDSSWKFAGYATNTGSAGRLLSTGGTVNGVFGGVLIDGVPDQASARFLVVGWSANIGATIGSVASWYNHGNVLYPGLIGQSAVSGSIVLGDNFSTPIASLFAAIAPQIQGFVLGQAGLLYSPAYITSHPTNKTAYVSGTAKFVARAYGDSSLPFSYQWRFNGTNIFAGGNFSMSVTNYYFGTYADFSFTITNVQNTNAGNYSVFISNAAGASTSSNALLTVVVAQPPVLSATRSGNDLQLTWPLAAGSFAVQSASNPAGPWTDLSLTIGNNGVTVSASVPITAQVQFFRLIVQ